MTTIRLGSSGSDVLLWQKKIGVEPDGNFGPITDAKTREWQTAHGLVADGIVGAKTWATVGLKTTTPPGGKGPMVARARNIIGEHEGRRYKTYLDQYGHPTVGVGFNLDRPDAPSRIHALGLDYNAVVRGDVILTDAQVNRLFDADFNDSLRAAYEIVPNFGSLSDNAKIVVIDMIFNMGKGGVANFTTMIRALSRKDYSAAVEGMVNSKWASQVPNRAKFDMYLMTLPDATSVGTTLFLLGVAGYIAYKVWGQS